jgi:hypothetical protein
MDRKYDLLPQGAVIEKGAGGNIAHLKDGSELHFVNGQWIAYENTHHINPSLNSNNTSYYNSPLSLRTATERDKSVTKSVTRFPDFEDFEADPSFGKTDEDMVALQERDRNVTLAQKIKDFVTDSNGWFSYEDVDKELGLKSSEDKINRRQIMKRLKDDGVIEAHLRNNKLFRHVKVTVRPIDFRAAGKKTPLAIKYPFGIEKYFRTYPGNVIVIAGAADAGKTAFLLNLIRLNMSDFSIYYQSSEMGAEELANRLTKFEDIALEDWNFIAEERSRDFADVIRPDCINIVDYLELAGDFYMVADYLKQIHDKLSSGIAIVALQKKRGAELGRGGDFGLEKPRLYLSMDASRLTIQKAKNWADPEVNPNGLVLDFKIVNGCKLIVTNDWHKEKQYG